MANLGLKWLKWDLHIHTPYSSNKMHKLYKEDNPHGDNPKYDVNNKDMWEKFITELEESDLDVIGINDYCHIDGYKKVIDYQKNGRLNNKFIIPVVEYRIDKFTEDKKINLHIIFDKDNVEKNFNFFAESNCIENTISVKNYQEYSDNDDIVYKFDEFKKIINADNNLKSKILIAISKNEFGPIQSSEKSMLLDSGIIDLFFSSCDNNSYDKNSSYVYHNYRNKILINTSDKHNCKGHDSHCNDFTKFTYIKASPTFYGLKLALTDKKNFNKNKPEEFISYINSIDLSQKKNFKHNSAVEFNKGLVSIIGHKSSGKSLLGALIANKCNINDSEQLKQIHDNYKDFLQPGDTLYSINKSYESMNIKYLSQSYINDITDIEKSDDLSSILKNIINSYKSKNNEQELNSDKNDYQSDLDRIKDINCIIKKEDLAEKETRLKSEKNVLESELNKINEMIKSVESNLEYKNISSEKEELNKLIEMDNKYLRDFKTIQDKLEQIIHNSEDINELLNKNQANVNNLQIDIGYFKEKFDKLDDKIKERNTGLSEKRQKLSKLEDNFKKIVADNENLKQNANNLQKKEELENKLKANKESIEQLDKDIKDNDDSLNNHQASFLKYIEYSYNKKNEYRQIKASFLNELKDDEFKELGCELEHIDFDINLKIVNIDTLYKNLSDNINNKDNKLSEDCFKERLNIMEKFDKEHYTKLYDYLCEIGKYLLKSTKSKVEHLRTIFSITIDQEYELKYKNKNILKHTPGQKGIILILILLLFDKEYYDKPIIIDQPEENLDNDTINKILVPAFKIAKAKRQIFLITHNPNLVVNAHSDQVIIANLDNSDNFQYAFGSIDTENIISKICSILEGGKEAFERRLNTYNNYNI
jgi:hypothetical protein